MRVSSSCEQADVLDGDHGLVGEGLQQLDLRIGEEPGRRARDEDRPDDLVLAHHRHREAAAIARSPRRALLLVLGIGEDIGHMDDGATPNGACRHCFIAPTHGERILHGLHALWRYAVQRDHVDQLAVKSRNRH